MRLPPTRPGSPGRHASIVVYGRREAEGKALEAELRSLGAEVAFIRADVRHEDDVRSLIDQTVARFGRIDAAVNAAGTEGRHGPLTEQTVESYAATFDTNVLGTLLSMNPELRVMCVRGRSGGGTGRSLRARLLASGPLAYVDGPGACWCQRGTYLQSARRRPTCGADRPAVSCSSTPSSCRPGRRAGAAEPRFRSARRPPSANVNDGHAGGR